MSPIDAIPRVLCHATVALLIIAALAAVATAEAQAQAQAPTAAPSAAREKEASIVAKQALGFYLQKKFSLAAELYRRASEIDPSKPDYHYGVGRAEQQAGRPKRAREAFERVLAMAADGSPLAMKSRSQLAIIDKQEAQLDKKENQPEKQEAKTGVHSSSTAPTIAGPAGKSAVPTAAGSTPTNDKTRPGSSDPALAMKQPPKDGTAPSGAGRTSRDGIGDPEPAAASGFPRVGAVPSSSIDASAMPLSDWVRPWMPWSVAAIGAVSVLTGGALLGIAVGDQRDLDDYKDAAGKFDGSKIGLSESRSRQSAINQKVIGGWAAVGIGALVVGAGSWWGATTPDARLAVWPSGRGAAMAWRF